MFPRRPYKRLVGDTARFRARFRDEHPDVPISTDRGSAYRAWLNAQRRQAQNCRPEPERLSVADNPILRRRYVDLFRTHATDDPGGYRFWLRALGIDPDTGKMTEAGLAFFKSLLDADRAGKPRRRRAA